jgi:hypothetical protein
MKSAAALHTILSRSKDHPARRAMLVDFELDAGAENSADCVVKELGWTLYCLHQDSQRAVFVRTPPDADLSATPFMRMAQYDHASQVMLVPWDQLDALAARVPLPENIIFVFNIGRSGTTLVSRMLGLVDGVTSLSEPNAQLDVTVNRYTNGPELTRKLIAACTRLQCQQPDGKVPHTLAFKTYSQSLFNCADYHVAFPQAKYVFLYRDAVSWANSTYKMARGYGMAEVLDQKGRDFIWNIASAGHELNILEKTLPDAGHVFYHEDISAASWALHFECYVKNLRAGVPFLALRYNEMNSDREGATRVLLNHCGLSTASAASAMQGFEQDSQEGSGIGQDNKMQGFTRENRERFLAAIARQAKYSDTNIILPDVYNNENVLQLARDIE